jgi:hypothetical protein
MGMGIYHPSQFEAALFQEAQDVLHGAPVDCHSGPFSKNEVAQIVKGITELLDGKVIHGKRFRFRFES